MDSDAQHPLFAELGYALASWSRMEHMLTALVIHINKAEASAALYDPDPQAKFGGMVRLLRTWIAKHPEFSGLSVPELDAKFYSILLAESELRNELAHSFLESINPDGSFTMRRIKRTGKDTWSPITTTYLPETCGRLAKQATTATCHFVELAKILFDRAEDAEPPPQTP